MVHQLSHLSFQGSVKYLGEFQENHHRLQSRTWPFVTSPWGALKDPAALPGLGAAVQHMLHPRELGVHPCCTSLRRPCVLAEISLAVVTM